MPSTTAGILLLRIAVLRLVVIDSYSKCWPAVACSIAIIIPFHKRHRVKRHKICHIFNFYISNSYCLQSHQRYKRLLSSCHNHIRHKDLLLQSLLFFLQAAQL
jgi:hypothetical protein